MFTWFLWALMGYIGFGIQFTHGAGMASFVTLWFSIIPTFVFIYTLRRGDKNIAPIDYVFLI